MHEPGIEPESQEWESCMIPLHHSCFLVKLYFLLSKQLIFSQICQYLTKKFIAAEKRMCSPFAWATGPMALIGAVPILLYATSLNCSVSHLI